MEPSDPDLSVDRYGGFQLTAAIRLAQESSLVPREGYRIQVYSSPDGDEIPMLAASVSRGRLFDVFLELLDQLGDAADVVLESHHDRRSPQDPPRSCLREYIDMPVLQSYCHEFKDLLLNDGCVGIAVVDPNRPCEVHFDDHKLLLVFAKELDPFTEVLDRRGIVRDDRLQLISEGTHLHSTWPAQQQQLEQFRYSLNADWQ